MSYFIKESLYWLKGLLSFNKKRPETLKERFSAGLLSREEFLRLKVSRNQFHFLKAKKELSDFLKKAKK